MMTMNHDMKTTRATGKTPNGTPWPITHETHSQEQINYSFRSPGSWIPLSVVAENQRLQENLDRVRKETGLTDPYEVIWALIKERGHKAGLLRKDVRAYEQPSR